MENELAIYEKEREALEIKYEELKKELIGMTSAKAYRIPGSRSLRFKLIDKCASTKYELWDINEKIKKLKQSLEEA